MRAHPVSIAINPVCPRKLSLKPVLGMLQTLATVLESVKAGWEKFAPAPTGL
jgi:hypothetical protein